MLPRSLPDQIVKVLDRSQVHLGPGQEGRDSDVHREPALDALDDPALHDGFLVVGFLEIVPDLQLVRLLLGEENESLLVFGAVEVDLDGVSHLHVVRAVGLAEFLQGDLPLGLVPDVDGDRGLTHGDHGSRDDLAHFHLLFFDRLLQQGAEVLLGILGRLSLDSVPLGRLGLVGAGLGRSRRIHSLFLLSVG